MIRKVRLQPKGRPGVSMDLDLDDAQVQIGATIAAHYAGTNETGKQYAIFRVNNVHTEVEEGYPGRDCDEPPSLAHPDPSCHVRMRLEGTLDEDRCNPDFCPCDEFVSQPSTSTDGRCPSCGGTLHYSNGTGWCPVCPGTLVLRPATDRHRLLEDFYAAYVAMQEAEGAPALLEHTEPRSQAYFDAVDARIAARSRFDKANKALRETS